MVSPFIPVQALNIFSNIREADTQARRDPLPAQRLSPISLP